MTILISSPCPLQMSFRPIRRVSKGSDFRPETQSHCCYYIMFTSYNNLVYGHII